MATETEIKKALTRLMDVFTIYNKDPYAIKAFTRIVVEKLSQFPNFILDRAVEKIIETQTFMPKIAEMLSACYNERDEAMRIINNKLQELKSDAYIGRLHPKTEWESIRDEYQKLGSLTSASSVMQSYEQYGKKFTPVSPEKVAKGKKLLDGLLKSMEAK